METVVESPSFMRSCEGVLGAGEVKSLIDFLALRPWEGDVIPASGGLRKLRCARAGAGKRGGARVIYYHVAEDGLVFLLLAYAKAAQENLTPEQLKRLRKALSEE
jgi:putative component of toxin-antitoxin plasmid stabilization module